MDLTHYCPGIAAMRDLDHMASEISKDEVRALAALVGVERRTDKKWLTVAELRSALMKVLLSPSEARTCKFWLFWICAR